jgi:hypothetical protein
MHNFELRTSNFGALATPLRFSPSHPLALSPSSQDLARPSARVLTISDHHDAVDDDVADAAEGRTREACGIEDHEVRGRVLLEYASAGDPDIDVASTGVVNQLEHGSRGGGLEGIEGQTGQLQRDGQRLGQPNRFADGLIRDVVNVGALRAGWPVPSMMCALVMSRS